MPTDVATPAPEVQKPFLEQYHELNRTLSGMSPDFEKADKGNKAAIRRCRHALQATKEKALSMRKQLADAGRKAD